MSDHWSTSLAFLAAHSGLLKFVQHDEDDPHVWAMVRVPGTDDRLVSRIPIGSGADPLALARDAVDEARSALEAVEARRMLQLVPRDPQSCSHA